MTLDNFETQMLKDALIEYWHNNMKHSKDERIKEKYRCVMQDFKTIAQTKCTFTIKTTL